MNDQKNNNNTSRPLDEEIKDGESICRLGVVLVRGDNIVYISPG